MATMLYLLSLQGIASCPFRVVDEINQVEWRAVTVNVCVRACVLIVFVLISLKVHCVSPRNTTQTGWVGVVWACYIKYFCIP